MNKQELERMVLSYQLQHFGERYVGATLATLDLPEDSAQKIAKYLEKPKNMLVFTGNPGIGKTRLCAALTEWSFIKFNTRRYHREEGILSKLRAFIGEGKGEYLEQLRYLTDDELVILDDVGSGINPEKVTYRDLEFRREVFFSFLDYRYNRMLPTIITSNFGQKEFEDVFSQRISSRLYASENTIVSLFGANYTDKRKEGK
jgi:DNA replication protein DnaC